MRRSCLVESWMTLARLACAWRCCPHGVTGQTHTHATRGGIARMAARKAPRCHPVHVSYSHGYPSLPDYTLPFLRGNGGCWSQRSVKMDDGWGKAAVAGGQRLWTATHHAR